MKKLLLTLCLCQTAIYAAPISNIPNQKNLLIDQQDSTDIFAIPYDESNEDDDLQIKRMRAQQAEYFKTHPEAYKKWLETHPQPK